MTFSPELSSLQTRLWLPDAHPTVLHLRVHRQIRQLILDGALVHGDRLPSTRALAKTLSISRDTAESAYAQLEAEGFLVRRMGSGSYVSARTDILRADASAGVLANEDGHLPGVPAISRRGLETLRQGGVHDQLDVHTFAAGIPETKTFPMGVWERMQRQVIKEQGTSMLLHGDPLGAQQLRRAIAQYLNQERGAKADPDQIMVLTSSQQALWLCAQVLLDAGDSIFVEDPCYHGASKAFAAAGLQLSPIPVDAEGMQVAQLLARPEDARVVYLTPSHQYPTGATLSLDRRLRILDWAQNGCWVIEDDYDSEFCYTRRATACLQGLDRHERTIYIGTFSKSLFPSLRIAYAVLPRALVPAMVAARTLLDGHTTRLNQLTLARFIESGHFGAHVRNMRKVYAARLDALSQAVQRHLGGVAIAHVPQGGLQMPCLLSPDWVEAETIGRARRVGIDLPSLGRLYDRQPDRGGWVMGFSAFAPQEIATSVARLARALRDKPV